MNVAFFVNAFPPETFILNQLTGLIDRGHQVAIEARAYDNSFKAEHRCVRDYGLRERTRFAPPTPRPWLARTRSGASRLIRHGWRDPVTTIDSLNVLRYGRRAANLSLLHEWLPENGVKRNYDVIHCHFGPNGLRAVALRNAGTLRGPIVTTFHGYDLNVWPKMYGPRLYKNLFDQGDAFTVGSELHRRRIIDLGAPEDRIAKLPMGVSLSRFRFAERKRPFDGGLRILTVARAVEFKGIEYALRAVAILKERYPHLRYRIVGDGILRSDLEALSSRLGLEGRVEFAGAIGHEGVVKEHESAHVFILPSVITASGAEENQSVALAEAQASGLPVIGTSTGGIPESMRDGKSGILVPPRNPEALASAISWFAENTDHWGPMGRAGRAYVEQDFDLEKLNDQLTNIYRNVIARHRMPPRR